MIRGRAPKILHKTILRGERGQQSISHEWFANIMARQNGHSKSNEASFWKNLARIPTSTQCSNDVRNKCWRRMMSMTIDFKRWRLLVKVKAQIIRNLEVSVQRWKLGSNGGMMRPTTKNEMVNDRDAMCQEICHMIQVLYLNLIKSPQFHKAWTRLKTTKSYLAKDIERVDKLDLERYK